MGNMDLYEAVRVAPPNALKEIKGGRLNGKSDINPMWRIKELTKQFGPCGIGWKYTITRQWLEQGGNDEIAAFVNIDLYIKYNGEWSEAIPGTGGSMFVAKEAKGPYTSDECFKMALTDAISVSCKALGFAADVYWDKDSTKYSNQRGQNTASRQNPPQDAQGSGEGPEPLADQKAINGLHALAAEKGMSHEDLSFEAHIEYGVQSIEELKMSQARELYKIIKKKPVRQQQAG